MHFCTRVVIWNERKRTADNRRSHWNGPSIWCVFGLHSLRATQMYKENRRGLSWFPKIRFENHVSSIHKSIPYSKDQFSPLIFGQEKEMILNSCESVSTQPSNGTLHLINFLLCCEYDCIFEGHIRDMDKKWWQYLKNFSIRILPRECVKWWTPRTLAIISGFTALAKRAPATEWCWRC